LCCQQNDKQGSVASQTSIGSLTEPFNAMWHRADMMASDAQQWHSNETAMMFAGLTSVLVWRKACQALQNTKQHNHE
jgi:hypothetical protein